MMTTDQRAVFNAAYRIGVALARKFEISDLTPELRQAARLYAASYDGDLDFMISMRDNATAGYLYFTDGQSKSILNCLMADAKRRMSAKQAVKLAETVPAPGERNANLDVPIGTFTVVFPDGYETIRIQKPQDKTDNRIFAKYLTGPDNESDFAYFATIRNGRIMARGFDKQVEALKVVMTSSPDQVGQMGMAYALRSSNCWRCGRTLTVPASIHSGLGPDCAAKVGAFYGEPPAPAAAPAPAATPAVDPETGVEESADELIRLANQEANEAAWYGEAPKLAASSTAPISSPVSLAEARARGRARSYQEIFGDES